MTENAKFKQAWDNWLNYREFSIEDISTENAEIGRAIKQKITQISEMFSYIFAGVKKGPELQNSNVPIYPATVHGIKQTLGYKFCEDNPQEVNALFDALVNLRIAQEKYAEQAKGKQEADAEPTN